MPQKYSTTFVSPSHFFTFNQYDYFGIKTKDRIDLIKQLSPYYENKGLCLALSIRYLIEERHHPMAGGKNYLFWLKNLVNSANAASLTIKDVEDMDAVQKKILNQYRRQHLSTELKKLVALNSSQEMEIAARKLKKELKRPTDSQTSQRHEDLRNYTQDLFTQARQEYADSVEASGLKFDIQQTNMITHLSSRIHISYLDFLHQLKDLNENKYFLLCIGQHAMAVSFIKKDNKHYWTFFDPNIGAFSFEHYEQWHHFMSHSVFYSTAPGTDKRRYAFSDLNNIKNANIVYTPFVSRNNDIDKAHWRKIFDYQEHYLILSLFNLHRQNKKFRLSEDIEAQIIGYTQDVKRKKIYQISLKIFYQNTEKSLILPFHSWNEIRQLMNKRIDSSGQLILNDDLIQDPLTDLQLIRDLTPDKTLSGRVKQAIKIIHQISEGAVAYDFIEQDEGMYELLKGFFKNDQDNLDKYALMSVIFNITENQQWMSQAKKLLIMDSLHDKFTQVSDQKALEICSQANIMKNKHTLDLISLLLKENYPHFSLHVIAQTVYIFNGYQNSHQDSHTLGLLWMKNQMRAQGEADFFSNAMSTHTFLNHQKSNMNLNQEDDHQLSAFKEGFSFSRQKIEKNNPHFFEINDSFTIELPEKKGFYWILSDKHILGLTIKEEKITLYDPNFGEIIQQKKTRPHRLTQFLKEYLNCKVDGHQTRGQMYGFELSEGHYRFIVKEANIDHLTPSTKTALDNFNTFMAGYTVEKNFIEKLPEITMEGLSFSPALMDKMGGMKENRTLSSHDFKKSEFSFSDLQFHAQKLTAYFSETEISDPHFKTAIEILRRKSQLSSQEDFLMEGAIGEKREASALKEALAKESFQSSSDGLKKKAILKTLSNPDHIKTMHRLHHSMQFYAYWLAFREFIKTSELLKNTHLTEEQRTHFNEQLNLIKAALSANILTDLAGLGLHQWGTHLNKMSQQLMSYSHIKKMKFDIGRLLTRYGAPFLQIFNAGFDIYDAVNALKALSDTADRDRRQDLIVQAALSGSGALLSISVAMVYMIAATTASATAATLAVFAGPIGLGAGIVFLAASQLYRGFRQLEDLQKQIQLTTTEKWHNLGLAVLGLDISAPVKERYDKTVTRTRVRADYDEKLHKQAEALFNQPSWSDIAEYYYSSGDFTLTKRFFKKIIRIKNSFRARIIKTLEDNIYPDDVESRLTAYSASDDLQKNLIEIVDSEHYYFEASPLHGVNDIIEATSHSDKPEPPLQNASLFKIERESSQGPLTALFHLGDGNDRARARVERKNIFKGGEGTKHYTGGKEADIFYLFTATLPEVRSYFNGGDGEDLIVAEHALEGSGYQGYAIDLQKNEVRFRINEKENFWPLIANLREIEHIHGNMKTSDYLVGNEKNNILNGLGGRDEIWGHEGNDTLILEQGIASGGPGIDHTIILKNTQPHPVKVSLEDDGEEALSLITFQYRYEEIKDVTLHLNDRGQYDIQILLKAKESQETTVIIKNAYQFVEGAEKNTLLLSSAYIFNTSDGLSLFAQFPELIQKNAQGQFPFIPRFQAQYTSLLDEPHQDYFKTQEPDNIRLSLNKSPNGDFVSVGKDTLRLNLNTQLVLNDTPFDDILNGDKQDNVLISSRGNDKLRGGKGKDIYQIQMKDSTQTERTVSIDNKDDQAETEVDLLMLPFKIEDLKIETSGQHVILSPSNEPQKNLRIKLLDFIRHHSYRHLMLMDVEQQLFEISLNQENRPYFFHPQSNFNSTEKTDFFRIYGGDFLVDDTLDSKGGNDSIFDDSHRLHTLRGGEGDDTIIAKNGNKKLFGDSGHDQLFSGEGDDELSGGQGNDHLSGGKGNDIYFIHRHDDRTHIEDNGGTDEIVLMGMALKDLRVVKKDEDMYLFSAQEEAQTPFSIKIKKGASSSEHKIEHLFVNGQVALIEEIASWDANEKQALIDQHNHAFLFQGVPFSELGGIF
ncbi:YopT-type cysteine protease domain-containing protein [Candidatus Williamhamiltonella defendens]|uniref:YopT-type cysteine protease domain-containing protein n=1 Tax=Candidatus Williamhamiltonella defendens TaxID=138072 RepID=UPI0015840887|nr:YopT-type cysteine protease domain-containing protein [Candidatus Hamiltonella defensa]